MVDFRNLPKMKAPRRRKKLLTDDSVELLRPTKSVEKLELGDKIDVEMTIEKWSENAKLVKTLPHLIENILPDAPGAYGIVAARTGLGKTNTNFHLGFCLATGTPYFGIPCAKVGVTMIAFEGDTQNLSERIDKIKANFPPTKGRFHFKLSPSDTPEKVRMNLVASLIAASERGDKVVVIDPIKYLVRGDYLDTKDAGDFTQELQTILRESGLTGIFSFPIRKPASFKGLITLNDVYAVKGATEWTDASTFVILVEKRHRTEEVIINVVKHRASRIGDLESIIVRFNSDKCMFERVLESVDGTKIKINL